MVVQCHIIRHYFIINIKKKNVGNERGGTVKEANYTVSTSRGSDHLQHLLDALERKPLIKTGLT